MYRPSELRQFLSHLGIMPKKGLSQNFLIDGNIIRKIVKTAEVKPGDTVLEIGPGPGALTEALLEAGAHVIAVEKDELLASHLERFKDGPGKLDIYCEDIMSFPIPERLAGMNQVKVIANLPYHLTTPILISLIAHRSYFSTFTVMVQEEVARRFTAFPGSKEYGSISVFLHFYTLAKYAFTVSRQCFYPVPKVDSAVVHLAVREPPNVNEETFFRMTRTAFEHRRKMLRASLRDLYSPEKVTKMLIEMGQNPLARPEDLSLEEFLSLHQKLESLF